MNGHFVFDHVKSPKSGLLVSVILELAIRSLCTLGGTLLGELFNRNDDAFYLYEPLAAVHKENPTIGCNLYETEKLKILSNYYNCTSPFFFRKLNDHYE